jgi:hypothetical protein
MEPILDLTFLIFFVPFLFRVAVALVFFYDARLLWKDGKKHRAFATGWLILAMLIGAGYITQLAVIVAGAHVIYLSISSSPSIFKNKAVSFLTLIILLSLFVTGAGGLAFDPFY